MATGARVIGTASPGNHPLLRELGAEPLAYGEGLEAALAAAAPDGVDVVLDFVGGVADLTGRTLRAAGRYVTVVDDDAVAAGAQLVWGRPDGVRLARLAQLAADGRLRVEVSATHLLDEADAALERVRSGHGAGKVVIRVAR